MVRVCNAYMCAVNWQSMFTGQFPTDIEVTFGQSVRLNCFDAHLATAQIQLTVENGLKTNVSINLVCTLLLLFK